jgi:transposase-like protein
VKQQSSQTRITRRHLTSKEKAEVLNEHARSGLSLLAFATKHGLCYSSLVRWRCRLGNGAEVRVPPHREADR